MKRNWMAASLFAAFAAVLPAQHNAAFEAAMKGADTASGALVKMESKTGPKAVQAAERIAVMNEEGIEFWRQRNSAEGVKWSEQGKAAALELANAAYAGDEARAAAALKAVNGTCKSCHDLYRERGPDGKFRFKEPKPDTRK